MNDLKKNNENKKVDTKEFELPETIYIRDIENRVFQSIILQCLSKIPEISLVEGGFFDSFLGRTSAEGIKGIFAEQDNANHSVNIKVEVNIAYGVPIPEKAEEIQNLITEEITKLTGLHVAFVHVVFKNVIIGDAQKKLLGSPQPVQKILEKSPEDDFSDEF